MRGNRDIPEDLAPHIRQSEDICHSFLFCLSFIIHNTARDPSYLENHLLSYICQDFLQSVISLPMLIQEGIHNACRRELRFILEMSIKTCFVQQKQYNSTVASKLSSFKSIFDSTNISIRKQLDLYLIPEPERPNFHEEVGRVYGEACSYVHLTHAQILERIELARQNRVSGREGPGQIESLNRLLGRELACSVVFLLHSVPEYVAGDLLVESDGSSLKWFFDQSRFIALMDEQFDYKHERQARLKEIKETRWSRVVM